MKAPCLLLVLMLAPVHSALAQYSLESRSAPRAGYSGSSAGVQCPCSTNFPDDNEIDLPMPARQAEDDQWFGTDKVRHFFISAMLQSLGYGTLRALDVRHSSALAGASVITAGFGIGKELSDRRHGRNVSARSCTNFANSTGSSPWPISRAA